MSQADKERELARARERADLARLRFTNAVDGVLDRLTPHRLRAEAIEVVTDQFEEAKRDLMARFKHWPVAVAAFGAALVALIFWRPARVAAEYAVRLSSIAWTLRDLWRSKDEQDRPPV